jgi:hypothetical protein
MLKWLSEKSVAIIPSSKTEVVLRDDSGTFEADPLHYQLSTLDFSFLVEGQELTLFFSSLSGLVEIILPLGVGFYSIVGTKGTTVYDFQVSGFTVSVKLRNLKNFDYITYRIEVLSPGFFVKIGKGTSRQNFWRTSYLTSERSFTTDFVPELGDQYQYANPQDYGLTTLDVTVRMRGDQLSIVFSSGSIDLTLILVNGYYVASNGSTYKDGTEITWRVEGTTTIVTVRKKGEQKSIDYSFIIRQQGIEIFKEIRWKEGTSNQIPVFSLPSGSLPRIEGNATLTPDGGMVCELDYEIINYNNNKKYIIYNLDFLSEVKGCKGTVPESVSYLQQFQSVDFTSFVGYAITRLILSQQLFGKFDTQYLFQKYYPCFVKKLKESEWKDFVPFFLDPEYGVENYHLLFK